MLRPTAVAVEPIGDFLLRVEFDNGEVGTFDVKPYIRGSWFGELRDPAAFGSVRANGVSVEWEGGQDICPDELYFGSVMDTR